MNESDQMLDVQDRLRADRDGSERQRMAALLDELRGQARRAMDAGAAPAEFQRLRSRLDAADAAAEILETAAKRYGPAA